MKKCLFALVILALFTSCHSAVNTKYLSQDDAEKVAAEHIYLSKDGFDLKLTETEAKEAGISPEDYKLFKERTDLFTQNLEMMLDTLGDNKLDFFFPLDKVDTAGLDHRLIIIDLPNDKVIDMTQFTNEE